MEIEFRPGNIVLVTSPDNFIGTKVAGVLNTEKWCPDGIAVKLLGREEPIPYICIVQLRGDTIKKVT